MGPTAFTTQLLLHRGDGGRFPPEVQGLFGGVGGKRRVGGSQYVVKLLLIRLYSYRKGRQWAFVRVCFGVKLVCHYVRVENSAATFRRVCGRNRPCFNRHSGSSWYILL